MNATNFVYWLNGYFEIGGSISLNEAQVREIKNHIDLATIVLSGNYPTCGMPTSFPQIYC